MACRWSTETSDEYLRDVSITVTRVQAVSARRIRKRLYQRDLGESETLDKLRIYMLARGFSLEDSEIQMVKLQVPHLAWREVKPGPEEPRFPSTEPGVPWRSEPSCPRRFGCCLPIPDEEDACQPELPEGSGVVSCEKAGKPRALPQSGDVGGSQGPLSIVRTDQ